MAARLEQKQKAAGSNPASATKRVLLSLLCPLYPRRNKEAKEQGGDASSREQPDIKAEEP